MKFNSKNEEEQISFDEAEILECKFVQEKIEFKFSGAIIKAKNSQNSRFQDMYSGEVVWQLQGAELARVVKEGMKYYDADGNLLEEIPDEDVPVPAQDALFQRLPHSVVFTTVPVEQEEGKGIEIGIDVPKEDDEEEVETYWFCIRYADSIAAWDRYCSPVEN